MWRPAIIGLGQNCVRRAVPARSADRQTGSSHALGQLVGARGIKFATQELSDLRGLGAELLSQQT